VQRDDDFFMNEALREADKAFAEDDVPVGALVVHEGRIIGKAHNQRELLKDPTAHAEMIALTQAAAGLDNWRLTGCTMYVTLEPCAMCAGALVLARVDRLVYAAADPKAGACGSVLDVVRHPALNHTVEVVSGIGAKESAELLQEFFKRKRSQKKAGTPAEE
jgi:tRNA(adenine34) deaminase